MATEGARYRDVTGCVHLKAVKDLKETATAGQTIRLSLDVSPELYETLTTLATKLHTTTLAVQDFKPYHRWCAGEWPTKRCATGNLRNRAIKRRAHDQGEL